MFWKKKSREDLQRKQNENLTDTILVLIKVVEITPVISKDTRDQADAKIKELINKIN